MTGSRCCWWSHHLAALFRGGEWFDESREFVQPRFQSVWQLGGVGDVVLFKDELERHSFGGNPLVITRGAHYHVQFPACDDQVVDRHSILRTDDQGNHI